MVFGLSRSGLRSAWLWQPLTYMFLHGGVLHLLFNMIGLFFFGPETERAVGTGRFLALYLGCGILGGMGWVGVSGNPHAVCIGASGAVFGVLGAFAGLFPARPVTLLVFFVLPVTVKARTLALLLGAANLFSLVMEPGQIAYTAHLVGGAAGYLYGVAYFRRLSLSPARWFADLRWHWLRRRFTVMRPGEGDPLQADGSGADEGSPEDVDRILEKIAARGIGSLTPNERDILTRASHTR